MAATRSRTALASALMERRPAAVTRLHTVVEADNHGSLTLLSRLGQMSSDLPNQGVREVTVELPRVNRELTVAEAVASMWAQAARKLMDESPLVRLAAFGPPDPDRDQAVSSSCSGWPRSTASSPSNWPKPQARPSPWFLSRPRPIEPGRGA